jgi:hypothetical protein
MLSIFIIYLHVIFLNKDIICYYDSIVYLIRYRTQLHRNQNVFIVLNTFGYFQIDTFVVMSVKN